MNLLPSRALSRRLTSTRTRTAAVLSAAVPSAVVLGAVLLVSACKPASQTPSTDTATPPAPAADTAPPASVVASFRCGDLLVGTTFDNTAGNVTLSWSGQRLTLAQAPSGSGARYADEQGNEFWNKGDNAMLTLAGVEHPECSKTDEVSPWDEARTRGVAFRGIGTEPGWWVEVDGGDTPALRAALDYGERKLDVASATRSTAATGFSGTAADGSAVTLEISDGECGDGMSDQSYPAHAVLTVGGKVYKGCGARLNP